MLKTNSFVIILLLSLFFLRDSNQKSNAAVIPFSSTTISSSSSPVTDPWEKAISDVTGDGQPDLIMGGPTGPLVFFKYPDWDITTIAGSGSYNSACGIATGDIDDDGDQDVIMGGIIWFENPLPAGNPTTGNWTAHSIGNHRSHDIVVGDMNNDGKLDVVSRNQGADGDIIYIFYQNTPTSWTSFSLAAFPGEGLALGDFDKDGDLDITISGYWYENPGTNQSWPLRQFASFEAVSVVKTGDINGDGRIDVVISASESTDELVWYEAPSDPKTQTWTKHQIAKSLSRTHGLALADYDKDGDMDVAASEFDGENRLIIFQNANGIGTSWASQLLGTQGLHNIQTADIGNDGDYDIFGVYCWGTPPIYLWINASPSHPPEFKSFLPFTLLLEH